jgi:hypothetical protein
MEAKWYEEKEAIILSVEIFEVRMEAKWYKEEAAVIVRVSETFEARIFSISHKPRLGIRFHRGQYYSKF